MGSSAELAEGRSEFRVHRIATFGRVELAEIMKRYTYELMGVEQPPLKREEVAKYELGRRAFGHLKHIRVIEIRKIDVYQTGPGVDDIRVRVFHEDRLPKPSVSEPGGSATVLPR